MIAFFGSVRILINAASSNSCNGVTTGKRPISSGIKPKCTKSSGSTCLKSSVKSWRSLSFFRSAAKPIPPCLLVRVSTILSNPAKAPPQIKRIFEVSTGIVSPLGCLREPCGLMFATVPSSNFKSAC